MLSVLAFVSQRAGLWRVKTMGDQRKRLQRSNLLQMRRKWLLAYTEWLCGILVEPR